MHYFADENAISLPTLLLRVVGIKIFERVWKKKFLLKLKLFYHLLTLIRLGVLEVDLSICHRSTLLQISRRINPITVQLYTIVKPPIWNSLEVLKNADIVCYILTPLVYLQQEMSKKSKKMIKIVNTGEENLYIFRTTWGILMKFSGKISLMIILKVTKSQGFNPSLENAVLEKQQGKDPPKSFKG